MATIKGVMGLSAMSTHKTDVSVTTGTITDANKIDLVTHLDLGQKFARITMTEAVKEDSLHYLYVILKLLLIIKNWKSLRIKNTLFLF